MNYIQSKFLNYILTKRKINIKNTIFFLDGHYSSGNTGKGTKDCPLIEEIQNIVNNFLYEAIIIIDDHRLFGKSSKNYNMKENWKDITDDKIFSIVKKRLIKYYNIPSQYDPQDRLILHIEKL